MHSTNCAINAMLSPFIRLTVFYYSIDWKYTRRYVVWVGIVILLWTLNVVSTLQCRNNNCHNVTENFTENKTSADRQAGWPNVGMKRSQIFQIFPIAATADFKLKEAFFKIAQKVKKFLGNCWMKMYCREFSKIAQSGHTVDKHEWFRTHSTTVASM